MSAPWMIATFVAGSVFGATLATWYMARAIHFLGLSTEVAVRSLASIATRAAVSSGGNHDAALSEPRP